MVFTFHAVFLVYLWIPVVTKTTIPALNATILRDL